VAERAPARWQRAGLEWLYRLLKEPKRIGRMLSLPKFMLTVLFRRGK
jgi:N-acetylglucosaminyldiphosphoundecaprenol N-acetyl-beta-D-mannosaminyltransferase